VSDLERIARHVSETDGNRGKAFDICRS